MPKSSTHRLLSELAALGIVRRTEDGRYSLGPRLLYWGEAAAETFDLRAIAEPTMRRLRDEVGESVHLYIRDEDTPDLHRRRRGAARAAPVHPARAAAAASRGRGRQGPAGLRRGGHPAAGARSVPTTTASACRTRPAPTSRASSSASASSAGRPRSASARTAWRPSRPRSTDSTGRVVAALCISGPTTRLTRSASRDARAAPGLRGRGQRPPAPRLTRQVRPRALGSQRVTAGT